MFRRVLAACVVALLLVCVPSALTAQGREVRAADQAVIGWLAGIWGDFAAWLAGENLPAPPMSSSGESFDTGCLIDPAGCFQGG